ncbi:S6 family peptidase [Citrobacter portucalensis]|uniref:S6 family peptidase n=1 Tax=Citrobacter portucalensis TaxID=1639133 RepID=UPI00226B805F|nr:S6 family peptidase [Citrobacter portucalensis]MCX8985540.1 autotransporter outer membrane beta-barrel domain-containing protein [Citrobacter portucalensis]
MNKKLNSLSLMLMMLLYPRAHASIVRDDINYQTYRDFAENKGPFYPGALNISILDVNGNLVGMLDKAPMPDFSSVDTFGVATLINPQYIASVKHNTGYTDVTFGGNGTNPDYHRYKYTIVDRNSHISMDFHNPRLDKLVTEVVPVEMSDVSNAGADEFLNNQRFPVYYRTGSGSQYVILPDGTFKELSDAYHYLTGGVIAPPLYHAVTTIISDVSDPLADASKPLWNKPQGGDSGSPLFGWDSTQNKWVIVGVMGTINSFSDQVHGSTASWVVLPLDFIKSSINSDIDPAINFNNDKSSIHWTFDDASGAGELSNGSIHFVMHGIKDGDLNAGKNLIFIGGSGSIILDNSVDQGAGTLTFNADYTVRPSWGETWKGGGIIVNSDKTVTWQVNGVAGDSLHKIGTGTLKVNATGENSGELSVGDGTVILDQQEDSAGKKQAFNKIDIVSGRPTVVLTDALQTDPNNIYFGFRGGRLDLNGNNLTFKRIKAVDSGARLVNHDRVRPASVTITGNNYDKNILKTIPYVGTTPSIYTHPAYLSLPDELRQFAVLVPLDRDQKTIINNKLSELNSVIFPGFFGENDPTETNGELNVHYTPTFTDSVLTVTGGANLNGTLSIDKGTVLLSGYPVLHADNIIFDDDWNTSNFTVKDIHISKNADFQVGEYARLQGNIHADENSQTVLGYFDDGTAEHPLWRCTLDDNTGVSHCNNPSRDDAQFALLPPTVVTGDITLADNASLSLGKVIYTGHLDGSPSSTVNMGRDSLWNMTENSLVGTLNMGAGSQVTFDPFPHTLTVNNLYGDGGTINLNTALADSSSPSDTIIIDGGAATGNTHLQVHNQGGLGAQTTGDGILLVDTLHGGKTGKDAFDMPGNLVSGAWRYNLYRKSASGAWYLTTDKLSLSMTSLTPASVSIPWTPLTPASVSIPWTPLTPASVSIPWTPLTPATITPPARVNDLQQGKHLSGDDSLYVHADKPVIWSGSLKGKGMLTKDGSGDLTLENSEVAQEGGVVLDDGNLILSGTDATFDVVAKEGTHLSLVAHSVLTGAIDPTDISVDNSSVWNVTGDSLLNDFSNDGVVSFAPPVPGNLFIPHTLTVRSLTGNGGTINLNAWLGDSDSPADRVVVDGGAATGHTRLVVHNLGGLGAQTTGEGIPLVQTINGGTTNSDAFNMPDPLTAGSWRYSLWRNPNNENWYLTSSATGKEGDEWVRSGRPDYSDAAWSFAGLSTQAMSYDRLTANTADSRVTEGMWSRVEGGRLQQRQDAGLTPSGNAESETDYAVIQVGGDIGSVETPVSLWRVGLYGATTQTQGQNKRDNGGTAGSVSDQIFSAGAYVSGHYHHGAWIDGQLQLSRHRMNVSLNDSQGRLTTHGTGVHLTTGAGWKLHAGGVDITPQAQYMVQGLNMDSEVDTAGTRYDADTGIRQQLQAGIKVEHELAVSGKEDKSARVWVMPSVLQSFGQRGDTHVGVDGRDETTVTFGPGSEGAAAGVDIGMESNISRQGKVVPDVLVGFRGRYQKGLSGSEPDGVGGQVTVRMIF